MQVPQDRPWILICIYIALQLTLTSDLPLEAEHFLTGINKAPFHLWNCLHFTPMCKKKLSCCGPCKYAPFRNMSARNMSSVQIRKHRNKYSEIVETSQNCCFCSAVEEVKLSLYGSCQRFNTTTGWQKLLWGRWCWHESWGETGGWRCGRTIIGM